MIDAKQFRELMCEVHRVRTPCTECHGSGRLLYGSTATWRGGIGGCSMTQDVCNVCWGTGCSERKGVDLRALADGEASRVSQRAMEIVSDRLGLKAECIRETVLAIAGEIEALGKSRRRTAEFRIFTSYLAKLLRGES